MGMYNRLFTKILDSSIWLEPLHVRVVWITFLAAMDEDGFCSFACPGNVARRAGVSPEEADEALRVLMAPDQNSSDDSNDGRRLEKVPGGYVVLNALKYKAIFNRDVERENTRRRVAKHRERVTACNGCNGSAGIGNDPVTQSESDTEPDTSASPKREIASRRPAKRAGFVPPTIDECKAVFVAAGETAAEGEAFWNFYESKGWMVGRNKMVLWRSAMAGWINRNKNRGGQHGRSTRGGEGGGGVNQRNAQMGHTAESVERASKLVAETAARLAPKFPDPPPVPDVS